MAKNYTEEETVRIINAYKESPSRETVDELAEELGKTVKSVIGKLSREKVYVKVAYKTKRGERPETKLQMTEHIADMLQGDANRLETLTKASKQELLYLKVLIEDLQWENEELEAISEKDCTVATEV
jgi:hypothetical protein